MVTGINDFNYVVGNISYDDAYTFHAYLWNPLSFDQQLKSLRNRFYKNIYNSLEPETGDELFDDLDNAINFVEKSKINKACKIVHRFEDTTQELMSLTDSEGNPVIDPVWGQETIDTTRYIVSDHCKH